MLTLTRYFLLEIASHIQEQDLTQQIFHALHQE